MMTEKMLFTRRELWKDKITNSESMITVFNFMNSHDLYFFSKDKLFRDTVEENNINFGDGFVVSVFLSLSNLRKIKRLSGTEFMGGFFNNKEIFKGRHLFIGSEKEDIDILVKKYPHLNKKDLFYYNPPYVQGTRFPREETRRISNIIKEKRMDFIWVGLGCPKQNFLSYDIIKVLGTKKKIFFFNVGAAMDFVLGKKKKAPKIFLKIGAEWLYRLLTDFKHSRKKVWRSFISLKELNMVKIE